MKKNTDFKKKSAYDWSLFSSEDYRLYKDILETSPYDPELARFFYEQKRYGSRIRKQEERHRSPLIPSAGPDALEEGVENVPPMREIREALNELTEPERRRFTAHLSGFSKKDIAVSENVSVSSIVRSIKRARRRIRAYLYD